jgi:hypothetical protein
MKSRTLLRFTSVCTACIIFDAQRLVITGATSGISDVMIYHLPTRQTERITQDFWDDLDARPFTFNGKKRYPLCIKSRLYYFSPAALRRRYSNE